MKNKNKHKAKPLSQDLTVLICLPVLATMISWLGNINFLFSSLLFFAAPSIYLSWRKKDAVARSAIFSLIFAAIGGVIFNYFAVRNNSWIVPTMFGFQIFRLVPIEDIVWCFFLTYFIVMFYELFFDHYRHKVMGRNMKYLSLSFLCGFVAFALLVTLTNHAVSISYFYLKGLLVLLLVPIIIFVFNFPRFIESLLKTSLYFFAVGLLNELVALHKGYWYFPGNQFIGWVTLGNYRFPVEELLYWMFIFTMGVIVYFEFYDDNRVKLKVLNRR